MRASIRLLAAVSRGPPSKLKKPAIGLDHVSNNTRQLSRRMNASASMGLKLMAMAVYSKRARFGILARDRASIE